MESKLSPIEPDKSLNQAPTETISLKKFKFLFVLFIVLEILTSLVAVYFGYQFVQLKKQVLYSQLNSKTDVGNIMPTVKPTSQFDKNEMVSWKTFSTYPAQFPISFKYPPTLNVAGRNYSGNYHIFISQNSITVPDMWDSPIAPIEMDYTLNNQRSYQSIIDNTITNLNKDALQKTELNINGITMTKISGVNSEGYLGGEKITTIVIDYSKGPILLTHFNSLFKDQPQITDATLDQIVSTFKLVQ